MNCVIVGGLLLCLFATGLAGIVTHLTASCASYRPHSVIHEIHISNCTKKPCPFKRGTYIKVKIVFTSEVAFNKCSVKAYGIIGSMTLPYSIDEPNCCKGMSCPVALNERKEYNTEIFVKEGFPPMSLNVKWTMRFGSVDGLCFMIPVEII